MEKKILPFAVLIVLMQCSVTVLKAESSKSLFSTIPEPVPGTIDWFSSAAILLAIIAVIAVPGFILYKKGKASETPQFLNKKEVMLGISVVLLSILSILSAYFSVVPSAENSGRYTHSASADYALFSLILVSFLGISAIWHGAYRHKFVELTLGVIVWVWGSWSWLGLGLSMHEVPFIRGSLTNHLNGILLLLIPDVILGIALTLNGLRKRKT